MDRTGDLDELAFGDRQLADQRARAERRTEPDEDVGTAGFHRAPVEPSTAAQLAAKVDVFGDGQARAQRQLLVDQSVLDWLYAPMSAPTFT